jgi:hypothetical protein
MIPMTYSLMLEVMIVQPEQAERPAPASKQPLFYNRRETSPVSGKIVSKTFVSETALMLVAAWLIRCTGHSPAGPVSSIKAMKEPHRTDLSQIGPFLRRG